MRLLSIIVVGATLTMMITPSYAQCPATGPAPRVAPSGDAYAGQPGFSLDEDGVLLFDYGESYEGLGKWPDPYFVSSYALALYSEWYNGGCTDDDIRDGYLDQAHWLSTHADIRGDMALWSYPFENPYYELEPGWVSGIGQSRIASVFLRANVLEPNPEYLRLADMAMAVHEHTLVEGGVMTFEDDVAWIEEAPDPRGNSHKILNGHITAMTGIMDVYAITGDLKWKSLFDAATRAVERDIAKFDGGFSSLYSLTAPYSDRPMAPRNDYNVFHVSQLVWLYETTGNPLFLHWASRFQAYDLRKDVLTASNSINPALFGPDQAAGFYGDRYWSTGTFPTWFRVDLDRRSSVSGIAIDGHTPALSPGAYSVTLLKRNESGVDEVVWSGNYTNDQEQVDLTFHPTEVDAVAIRFDKTVSDEVLALDAVGVIRTEPQFATVGNDCNYRTDSTVAKISYNVDRATDGDPDTAMTMTCPGFVATAIKAGTNTIQLIAGNPDIEVTYATSPDMLNWSDQSAPTLPDQPWTIPAQARFLMVNFPQEIGSISEIVFR